MESSEIRFKYKNRGKRYVMPRGLGSAKSCKDDPTFQETAPGRFRKVYGSGDSGRRETRAANEEEFMVRQVTKHELLIRDMDEGKFR